MAKPDSYSYPPRGLSRDDSARYIGVGVTKFEEMVADGRMPKPKRIDGRVVWDRLQLEAAFTDLPEDNRTNPLGRVIETSASTANQPKIRAPRVGRPRSSLFHTDDPALIEQCRAAGLKVYEDGEWEEMVRNSPLTKLEHRALEGYFNAKRSPVDVKGGGLATCDRLIARGFIEVVKERGEGREPYYGITEAGEQAWRNLEADAERV